MTITGIANFSIDSPPLPLGYFGRRKVKGKNEDLRDVAQKAIDETRTLTERLESTRQVLENPASLGFYVPSQPEQQKPAEVIRNVILAESPYFRSKSYGMLNSVALHINGETPSDPLLREQIDGIVSTALKQSGLSDRSREEYHAAAKALLLFDLYDFLLDFVKRDDKGLDFSTHPQAEVSHTSDNRFPFEPLRLQHFMKRYGLQMRDVVGDDAWKDVFSLDTKYGHRHGLSDAEFAAFAGKYLALVDEAGSRGYDNRALGNSLNRLMIDGYKLGQYMNPEVAIGLRAIPRKPVELTERLSVIR